MFKNGACMKAIIQIHDAVRKIAMLPLRRAPTPARGLLRVWQSENQAEIQVR